MKRVKFRYIFAVYAAVVAYVCMFMIYPAHDDFYYAAPKPGMNLLESLKPTASFWRPFDRLIEYGLGYAPYLFPYVNHFVILMGHFLLCALLYAVLKKLTGNKNCSLVGALYFCVSPCIVCTVTNSDFINQVWAILTGMAATFFFFRARITGKSGFLVLWLLLALVATLVKENGIVWFIAPVMLYVAYSIMSGESLSSALKHNFVYFLVGIAGMILYFGIRFYFMGGFVLGAETDDGTGRYTLNFSPLHIIRNYSIIIGGASTALDSLAIFLKPRNIPIIIITGIISAVFLGFVAMKICYIFRHDRQLFTGLVMLFVSAGYISSPYAVMGYNSEATAYEMTFMIGLMLGMILHSGGRSRFGRSILVAMFACMILSSGHKICVMHEYTLGVHNFIVEHAQDFRRTPAKAYVYFIEDIPRYGYATYKYTMGHGLANGIGFKSVWGWRTKITINHVSDDAHIDFTPDSLPEYDTVFSLSESGKLNVLRN